MTADLLTKATALLEAREVSQIGELQLSAGTEYCYLRRDSYHFALIPNIEDARYFQALANTACDTITGYQDLLRRMAEVVENISRVSENAKKNPANLFDCMTDIQQEARQALDEARTAIPAP